MLSSQLEICLNEAFQAAREARHEALRKELHAAWKPLAKRIKHIEIEYDGCGDSGAIERISFLDAANNELTVRGAKAAKLRELLQEYWDVVLPIAWEDNDGAYGTISLDWKSQKINVEHNDRFTDYSTTTIAEKLEE